ncbi:MAG TPA: phosphate/phosphite/phosphonate ABC transporter substrate-binding protein [Mucilaginibacter sp.]
MHSTRKTLIVLTAILGLFLSSCGSKGSVDSNGMPKTLEVAVIQAEGFQQFTAAREKIYQFLGKKLGMKVEMITSTDYNGVIEALKAHKVHMADIPPFAYVLATRSMKLTPIVTLGIGGKPSTYSSVIIVNGHSNLKSMDDVKANSKKLTFCFVEPASTSGHLIPRAYLNTIGLNPDTAFKQVIFAGNHAASVMAVKSEKIDVGCTTDLVFGIMTKANMLKDGDLRVVWTSAPIVSDPVVMRDDVNKDFTKKVQQAYLDMNTEAPELLQNYIKIFMKDSQKRSYIVAQDSMYNGLRSIAGGIKDLK